MEILVCTHLYCRYKLKSNMVQFKSYRRIVLMDFRTAVFVLSKPFQPVKATLRLNLKRIFPEGIPEHIESAVEAAGYSPQSIAGIGTIELKKDEPLLQALQARWPQARTEIFPTETLAAIDVPNPSDKALAATGSAGVAEAAAIAADLYTLMPGN